MWVDSDGPIPEALAQRARAIADDPAAPLGTTEGYPLPGVMTLIRVEPHTWSRDAQGNLVSGCFRASGIYLPANAVAVAVSPPSSDKLSKAVGVFTVVSLVIGTAATIATWGKR